MQPPINSKHVANNTAGSACKALSARLFMCGRCRAQTKECSCCDRGNVYCIECRSVARKEARKDAAKRYQQSYKGRLNHAERQRRYREKRRVSEQKVTHQGSSDPDNVLTQNNGGKSAELPYQERSNVIVCDFCEGVCSNFLRLDYLFTAR